MFFVSEAKRSGRGREDRVSKQDKEIIWKIYGSVSDMLAECLEQGYPNNIVVFSNNN